MKILNIYLILIMVLFTVIIFGQDKIEETTFKVYGNCDQCKDRIEEALDIDEVKFAKWNKVTKNLKIAYSDAISLDSLKHRIALVGHDSDAFTAADSVYTQLPGCCLYRDNAKTH